MTAAAEIFVAVPSGYGLILHLHSPGYQPGTNPGRRRSEAYPVALCNNRFVEHDTLVPLHDGLDLKPTGTDPRPAWRWCRVCIGHAVALVGLDQQVLTWIATGQQEEP